MGDMLSQDEINALLNGSMDADDDDGFESESSGRPGGVVPGQTPFDYDDVLVAEEKDILGEVGNISMGTAATTLFALLGKKVSITTPVVTVHTWGDIQRSYDRPCVGTRIDYIEGLRGSNVLVLSQSDVKIITNLMMGGDGIVDPDEEITDIDMSAIGEAMNQMIGSSSTSLSSLIKLKIDIAPPKAFLLKAEDDAYAENIIFDDDEKIVCISFRMEIDSLVDSQITQLIPVAFSKDMVVKIKGDMFSTPAAAPQPATAPPPPAQPQQQYAPPPPPPEQPQYAYPPPQYEQSPPQYAQPQYAYPPQAVAPPPQNINVQPVQFQSFDIASLNQQKENIGIIMDVPLEISVELGRTSKKIKEILEFAPGTIIELDKLAGEPIDILVNGKFVAKGEVVVVMDENFGIRLTDIIDVENRI
ncbi:hypothetical protein AGMMS49975_22340 [Clostridia bacterium]|nr:hypothetical protein AGMMS49975_22340 [Clostridia bacterium]